MRQKARIIAKLAAKYRASAFFVNALAEKTANFFPRVNEGYPEYRGSKAEIGFVNKSYRWVETASCKAWRAIASL
ncbi:hypothetical protein [Marinobacter nauticus]|uniref:hypothetical protein n=1 Tax=Marinobacter nauticus TaxID=2743 RepID=UPI001C991968|nr:hypothetical protein [Marinobacter nauticus]MBY5935844.1 hypothetical protein [Marinobacter nauticus]MBY5953073.1 hypothetical protein [Marinobacter nauticus]MBY6006866.1 hypothetical protein [Marinobacter nauticus]